MNYHLIVLGKSIGHHICTLNVTCWPDSVFEQHVHIPRDLAEPVALRSDISYSADQASSLSREAEAPSISERRATGNATGRY